MSERWKPKHGETYYFVDSLFTVCSYAWRDDGADAQYHKCGNCFRTAKEAAAAAEKVKALLLSLHYNGTSTANSETLKDTFTEHLKKFAEIQADVILQKAREQYNNAPLPKLTAEVFDRPDCPEWAQYAMVNDLGYGYWYEENPGLFCAGYGHGTKIMFIDRFDASDWQNSLIERPEKKTLPDWCKQGEWVCCWDEVHGEEYSKIIAIKTEGMSSPVIHFDNGGKATYGSLSWDDLKPARLRPYNAEEMKALMGKVLEQKNGDAFMVTAYTPQLEKDVCAVDIDNMWVTPDDVLKNYTINGKPCGVLEHLENGEWVE